MDFSCRISVVMTTYNAEISILEEAVNSILNQSFKDFEFIIIDDGSDNGLRAYLESIKDERVKLIFNPDNIGITKSLNIGFKLAQGKYIARMDSDDVSVPTRLEKEYSYMEKHPNVFVCGSETAELANDAIMSGHRKKQRPINMEEYRVMLLFKNPGPIHPTTMFRHEPLLMHNIVYDERLIHAQDYGMCEVVSHYGKIHVLNDVLLYRRKHEKQISVARRELQINCDKMTQKKILSTLLGNVTDEEVSFHYIHSSGYFANAVISPEVVVWYDRLIQENKDRNIYNHKYLKKHIVKVKKRLVIRTFTEDTTFFAKVKMIFRYIPFLYAVRMIGGHIIRFTISKLKGTGNSKRKIW